MAICAAVDIDGYIVATSQAVDSCASYVLINATEYQIAIEPQINATEIATAFTWGFGTVVVLGWFSGYAIGIAKRVIRLI